MEGNRTEIGDCFDELQAPFTCLYFHEGRRNSQLFEETGAKGKIVDETLCGYPLGVADVYPDNGHVDGRDDDNVRSTIKKCTPIISLPGDIDGYREAEIPPAYNQFPLSRSGFRNVKRKCFSDTLRKETYDRQDERVNNDGAEERSDAKVFNQRSFPETVYAFSTYPLDKDYKEGASLNGFSQIKQLDVKNSNVSSCSLNKSPSLVSNESKTSNFTNTSDPDHFQERKTVSALLPSNDFKSTSKPFYSPDYDFYILQKPPSTREEALEVQHKDRKYSSKDHGKMYTNGYSEIAKNANQKNEMSRSKASQIHLITDTTLKSDKENLKHHYNQRSKTPRLKNGPLNLVKKDSSFIETQMSGFEYANVSKVRSNAKSLGSSYNAGNFNNNFFDCECDYEMKSTKKEEVHDMYGKHRKYANRNNTTSSQSKRAFHEKHRGACIVQPAWRPAGAVTVSSTNSGTNLTPRSRRYTSRENKFAIMDNTREVKAQRTNKELLKTNALFESETKSVMNPKEIRCSVTDTSYSKNSENFEPSKTTKVAGRASRQTAVMRMLGETINSLLPDQKIEERNLEGKTCLAEPIANKNAKRNEEEPTRDVDSKIPENTDTMIQRNDVKFLTTKALSKMISSEAMNPPKSLEWSYTKETLINDKNLRSCGMNQPSNIKHGFTSMGNISCTAEFNSNYLSTTEVAVSNCRIYSNLPTSSNTSNKTCTKKKKIPNIQKQPSHIITGKEDKCIRKKSENIFSCKEHERSVQKFANPRMLSVHELREFLCEQGVDPDLLNKAETYLKEKRKTASKNVKLARSFNIEKINENSHGTDSVSVENQYTNSTTDEMNCDNDATFMKQGSCENETKETVSNVTIFKRSVEVKLAEIQTETTSFVKHIGTDCDQLLETQTHATETRDVSLMANISKKSKETIINKSTETVQIVYTTKSVVTEPLADAKKCTVETNTQKYYDSDSESDEMFNNELDETITYNDRVSVKRTFHDHEERNAENRDCDFSMETARDNETGKVYFIGSTVFTSSSNVSSVSTSPTFPEQDEKQPSNVLTYNELHRFPDDVNDVIAVLHTAATYSQNLYKAIDIFKRHLANKTYEYNSTSDDASPIVSSVSFSSFRSVSHPTTQSLMHLLLHQMKNESRNADTLRTGHSTSTSRPPDDRRSFISRKNLLPLFYGIVCLAVFWCLQFPIARNYELLSSFSHVAWS